MERADIQARLKCVVEDMYNDPTGANFVEVINFELRDDDSLRIYVKVGYMDAPVILHGRINDIRDFRDFSGRGIDLTPAEREFLRETASQAPARIATPTKVSQSVRHLVSQLRHIVGDGSELSCLTGALLSNSDLLSIIYVDVDSIVAYVERTLTDLACDHRSGAAVSWVTSLLSNPSLRAIIAHQQRRDDEVE